MSYFFRNQCDDDDDDDDDDDLDYLENGDGEIMQGDFSICTGVNTFLFTNVLRDIG